MKCLAKEGVGGSGGVRDGMWWGGLRGQIGVTKGWKCPATGG